MPFNLEIKIAVKSLNEVEKKLSALNAENSGVLIQTDIYYKTKNGLLKLRMENGENQLIHYFRNETVKDRWSDYSVLKINDYKADKFLAGLFKTEVTVKKSRNLYWYKNTRIHLDKVKGLGTFLELETKLINGKKEAKERFDFLVNYLQLDAKKQIRQSYRDLLLEREI